MYKVIARNLADGTPLVERVADTSDLAWDIASYYLGEGARSVTISPL